MAFDGGTATALARLGKWLLGRVGTWWNRPQVTLDVRSDPPHAVQTQLAVHPTHLRDIATSTAHYYRVRATNTGRTPVRSCRVTLQAVLYADAGVWRRLDSWQPVPLIWAGAPNAATVDLSSGEERFADIAHLHAQAFQTNRIRPTDIRSLPRGDTHKPPPARLFLDTQISFNAQPNALPRGRYCLELVAYSDNASTSKLPVELVFPGRYATLVDVAVDRLAGVTLDQRAALPEVGTVAEELPAEQ